MKRSEALFKKEGRFVAILSLVVALLAFYPSIIAFTPAIALSFGALFGAALGAFFGWKKLAILTIYVVFATVLVAPFYSSIKDLIELGTLINLLMVVGLIVAGGLLAHYKISVNSDRLP